MWGADGGGGGGGRYVICGEGERSAWSRCLDVGLVEERVGVGSMMHTLSACCERVHGAEQ